MGESFLIIRLGAFEITAALVAIFISIGLRFSGPNFTTLGDLREGNNVKVMKSKQRTDDKDTPLAA